MMTVAADDFQGSFSKLFFTGPGGNVNPVSTPVSVIHGDVFFGIYNHCYKKCHNAVCLTGYRSWF